MKTYFSFLMCVLLVYASMAQKPTVARHSGGEVFIYEDATALTLAYNAAEAGDTLYLSGGIFTSPSITKKIHLIGIGFHPDSTATTGASVISGDLTLSSGSSGSSFEGLEIIGNFQRDRNSSQSSHITIKRCKINGAITRRVSSGTDFLCQDWLVQQNIILNGVIPLEIEKSLFANNIIGGQISRSNRNMFRNNAFLLVNGTSSSSVSTYSSSNNFHNNIFSFTDENEAFWSSSYNNFYNNVFQVTNENLLGSHSIAKDNYYGVDLDDVYTTHEVNVFSFAHDYMLQEGMEELYKGDDGTQVGIYGGFFPVKRGWLPSLPHIISYEIGIRTGEDGKLPVEFKVSAQEN